VYGAVILLLRRRVVVWLIATMLGGHQQRDVDSQNQRQGQMFRAADGTRLDKARAASDKIRAECLDWEGQPQDF